MEVEFCNNYRYYNKKCFVHHGAFVVTYFSLSNSIRWLQNVFLCYLWTLPRYTIQPLPHPEPLMNLYKPFQSVFFCWPGWLRCIAKQSIWSTEKFSFEWWWFWNTESCTCVAVSRRIAIADAVVMASATWQDIVYVTQDGLGPTVMSHGVISIVSTVFVIRWREYVNVMLASKVDSWAWKGSVNSVKN